MTECDEEQDYVEAQRRAALADLALTVDQRAVLGRIIESKTAWSSRRRLAACGRGTALAELETLGMVAHWGDPWVGRLKGDYATLTPWGAWVLGLELDEQGPDDTPRWVETGSELTPIRQASPSKTYRLVHPQLVVDPAPGPLEQLIAEAEVNATLPELMGVRVRVDRRLKPGSRAGLFAEDTR